MHEKLLSSVAAWGSAATALNPVDTVTVTESTGCSATRELVAS
jgi:hypothetical protein